MLVFFFSSRRRHTRFKCDWSSDVCSSDLYPATFGRRDCPCCPGTKLRFSIAHFSVKQRKPFKNNFCPSRRHRRQTASRCLANFYSPFPKLSKSFLLVGQAFLSVLFCLPRRRGQTRMSVLHAAALRRTAAVVRNRSDIADYHDVESRGGQCPHSRLASGTGTLHANLHALHPVLITRHARGSQRGLLRGVRRAFARSLKPDRPRRGPAHGAPVGIPNAELRLV